MMHKDTRQALERLEAELLAQEPEEDTDEALDGYLDDDHDMGDPGQYRNFANGYRAWNSDDSDLDLEEYADEVYEEPKKSGIGAVILALVCLAGAVAALLYMAARML